MFFTYVSQVRTYGAGKQRSQGFCAIASRRCPPNRTHRPRCLTPSPHSPAALHPAPTVHPPHDLPATYRHPSAPTPTVPCPAAAHLPFLPCPQRIHRPRRTPHARIAAHPATLARSLAAPSVSPPKFWNCRLSVFCKAFQTLSTVYRTYLNDVRGLLSRQ